VFLSSPVLEALPDPDKWVLREALIWQSPTLRFTIQPNWITDLASIPSMLRGLMDVNGRSRFAAIAHDWTYNTQVLSREECDELLRSALITYGLTPKAARTYWAGVRVGGALVWNARLKRGGGLQPDDFATADAFMRARDLPRLGSEIRPKQ